ncbi:OmpA family protein [Pseudohalocynthiibacter aestuariivivens]|jgi:peptidoglycan-associated lipoprotein|uniref:OmpA family protein n=1 Tax=Pseudohalocynthiibacter aestuariivivens TaxID=1591409 RepID=A0ABV5JAR1_9RHOB|nr:MULTISPECIES: OmpA family protein [Pseudohalocynthiibacter]MBS9715903.1 OmpA family protein [Pseudohalocynthiibacter aestuariivivens]MCK0101516.1 OmpA family protein [Pseudohalocynthiibacter sp. F2068]
MRGPLKSILIIAATASVAGCGQNVLGSFYSEAGSVIDGGDFGNTTMNNTQIQSGQRSYAVSLAHRFEAEVPSTINFAFNSSTLDAEAQQVLNRQANWILQFPEIQFRVFGHTDLVGSDAYNRTLGLRRAQAAVRYLVGRGVNRSRLQAVSSLGETQPLIATPNPERRNRRTVTQVSGFVQNNPMVLNGKYAEVVYREYVDSATERSTLITVPSQAKAEE